MKKRLLSLLTVMAMAMTFVFSVAVTDDGAYAASKSKKYYLPVEVFTEYYDDEDSFSSLTNIKYDKYGNLKSAIISDALPVKYNIKYRNSKGKLASLTYGYGEGVSKKYYDKKGRLTKVKVGDDTYKFTTNKKGIITKVTRNGKKYYNVKSIKYHKNGFVKTVVYGNGNVNNYNSDGLLTSAKSKNGTKFRCEYTKKNGKVVKMMLYTNGKKSQKVTLKYGKKTTKNVWQYSCLMNYAGALSIACELYGMSPLSGINVFE